MRRRKFALVAPEVRVGFLFGWFGVAMLTAVIQRAIAITYLGPELAPLLLAGVSVVYVMSEFERFRPAWRLAALTLVSVALALSNPGNDLSPRLPAGAVVQAAEAIRASGPAADDRVHVVNRELWINIAAGLAPATRHFFPPHILCDFTTDCKDHLRDILDSRPRYIIVADRRIIAACERADRWAMVDAELLRD